MRGTPAPDDHRTAAFHRALREQGYVVVQVEPSDGLLMSMAMRYDHGLGCLGYYDQPMFGGTVSHARKLEVAITTMRQLHEEVVGTGFYNQDREEWYRNAMIGAVK